MRAQQENTTRRNGKALADLMNEEAELQQRLQTVQMSLQEELTEPVYGDSEHGLPGDQDLDADWRTDTLINRGRHGTARSGLPGLPGLPAVSRWLKIVIIALLAVVAAALVIMNMTSSGPSWPASVATMQSQISRACPPYPAG